MTVASYNVTGEIRSTHGSRLAAALRRDGWNIKASGDEVKVSGPNIHFEMYVSEAAGRDDYDFLVSADVTGSRDQVHAMVGEIAERLGQEGIVYHFEVEDPDSSEGYWTVEHPDFQIKPA